MFTLPKLPYDYDTLEPYIDATTMEIHYSKHHQTYMDKLNVALEKHPELQDKTIEELLTQLPSVPEDIRGAVKNNGGGYYHHSLFWTMMTPKRTEFGETMNKTITSRFGSLDAFKNQFTQAGLNQFGSGWAWLIVKEDATLDIVTTSNQDSPISLGYQPILGLDVWEHAYYLKYQNRRVEYIENWWNTVNWAQVEANYRSIKI
jgi:superoxide dismutase, Fe-Mn family